MARTSWGVRSSLVLALMATSASPAAGQATDAAPAGGARMEEREEIRLALSAGPPTLHAGAGVYVLGADGYRLVRESSNGFHCLVERTSDPTVRAPQCFDAIASEYVLPVKFEEARLRLAGRDDDAIEREISAGFASGRFRPPPEPAFNYMLSGGQYLGEGPGRWNPHVMIYTPYRTNQEIGGMPRTPEYPFVGFDEGKPLSLTIIVTTRFVDPDTVEIDG